MKVGIFRGGCLTGPSHSGVELHGVLSYLVKVTLTGGKYSVSGYKGKQVRDNIHSHDVVRAIEEFLLPFVLRILVRSDPEVSNPLSLN